MADTLFDRIGARANGRGALWMLVSILTASVMTLSARAATEELSSPMLVMLRAIGGLAMCVVAFGVAPQVWRTLSFSRPWLHLIRGAMVGVSTHLGFYAISEIPLATATVLFFTAPIYTTLLAPLVLGERVGLRRLAAVGAGFVGVLIIVRPGGVTFEPAYFAALFSSVLFALVLLMSRAVANRDGAWATYISSAAVTVLISAPVTVPEWHLPVSTYGWIALALVAASSMVRNIADIQAYRLAEASFLAPLAYTRIVFITAGAFLLFDETPDSYTLLGGAVIIAAALYIARREAQMAQNR